MVGGLLVIGVWLSPAMGQSDPAVDLEQARVDLVQGSLELRLRAVSAASEVESEAATALLTAALLDPAEEVRRLALRFVGSRGLELSRFATVLSAPEPGVRVAALQALAQAPDEERWAVTLAALSDPAPEVQLTAAELLLAYVGQGGARCEPLLDAWRELQGGAELVVEALASTLMQAGGAAPCVMGTPERERVETHARRYVRYQTAPELSLLGRRILKRLGVLRQRIQRVERTVTQEDVEYCVWPILNGPFETFEPMVKPVSTYGTALVEGGAAVKRSPDEMLRELSEVEQMVEALEECVAQEHGGLSWSEPDLFDEPFARRSWWMQLGLETHYDDHFLAVRHDVERLRVTDQLTQRLLSQLQWTSEPALMGQGPWVDGSSSFVRVRAELGSDLFYGENALSGVEGWGDIYGHLELGSDGYLFGRFNAELSRGLYEVAYPELLVAPRVRTRSLLGYRTSGVPFDPGGYGDGGQSPTFAVALGAETLNHLEVEQAAVPERRSVLVPATLSDADRHQFSLFMRWTPFSDSDLSLFVEGFAHASYYPSGMPGLSASGEAIRKDPWAVQGSIQPGVVINIENAFRIWAWVGVELFHVPAPFDESIVNVSAESWAILWEGDRSNEGGRLAIGAYRRLHDGPGREDIAIENGGEMRLQWWIRESDFYIEMDFGVFGHYLEQLARDTDRNAVQVGLALRSYFQVGTGPMFFIDFSTQAERADDRHDTFVEYLGRPRVGDEDDAFWRNVILLGVYIPFGGANPDFMEARRGRVGLSLVQNPIIPERWWNE